VRLTALAVDVPTGRLQSEAEVLLRLTCEPLSLPGDGRLIALDVSQFEEALMDSGAVEPLLSHFPR
jgi:hypothetical protein